MQTDRVPGRGTATSSAKLLAIITVSAIAILAIPVIIPLINRRYRVFARYTSGDADLVWYRGFEG